MDENPGRRRRYPRFPSDARVEFFIDADIVVAETEDISQGGIRVSCRNPVKTFLRVTDKDGSTKEYEAEMIWSQRNPDDNGMTFGLQFIDPQQGELELVAF